MEYRAYIEIPNFPTSDQNERAFALMDWLRDNTDMGPVMGGPGERPGAELVLATDAADEATATRAMIDAATRGLEAIGLGHLYPASIDLEPVGEPLRA